MNRWIRSGIAFAFVMGFTMTGPQAAGAAETRSYWDHGYSKDCRAERRSMMETAHTRAESWCRSRGGVDRRRTNFRFVVDKGQKLGPAFKTHFCEVRGTIVCN